MNHAVLVVYPFYTLRHECERARRRVPGGAKRLSDAVAGTPLLQSRQRVMTGPVLFITLCLREMPPTGSESDMEMRVVRGSLLLFLGSSIQAPPLLCPWLQSLARVISFFKASPLCHRSGSQSYQQLRLFSTVFTEQLSAVKLWFLSHFYANLSVLPHGVPVVT